MSHHDAKRGYSTAAISHALAHHHDRGAITAVRYPSKDFLSRWEVTLPGSQGPVVLNAREAWVLCLALRAGETVAQTDRERFVHELAAYAALDGPPCLNGDAARLAVRHRDGDDYALLVDGTPVAVIEVRDDDALVVQAVQVRSDSPDDIVLKASQVAHAGPLTLDVDEYLTLSGPTSPAEPWPT